MTAKLDPLSEVRTLVASSMGLQPPQWVLQARVAQRMQALAIATDAEYTAFVTASSKEQSELVELLRVGETRFFRHKQQMKALESIIFPELKKQAEPSRIWSAGCATGEEAYTLAMLARSFSVAPQIVASDISHSSLRIAREAVYPQSSLDSVPAAYRSSFSQVQSPNAAKSQVKVMPSLRALISFEHRNLAAGNFPTSFDLILCRNVLIYFTPEAKRKAIARLVQSLRPGGFLLVGHSESLVGISGLESAGTAQFPLYRKNRRRSSTLTGYPQTSFATQTTTAPGHGASAAPPKASPATYVLRLSGDYSDCTQLAKQLKTALETTCSTIEIHLDGASFLGEHAASLLKRAMMTASSMHKPLVFKVSKPGPLRFAGRYNLAVLPEK